MVCPSAQVLFSLHSKWFSWRYQEILVLKLHQASYQTTYYCLIRLRVLPMFEQASRYNPAPWIGPQHQKGGSQYSIPRPNQSYPSRAIGGPRATGTPSAGPSLSHTIPQAPSITQQAMTAGPSLLGESGLQAGLSLQQNSDILSMQHSSQMSLHPSSHDSSTLPPLSTMRSTSQRLPSIPVQGRQILPGRHHIKPSIYHTTTWTMGNTP